MNNPRTHLTANELVSLVKGEVDPAHLAGIRAHLQGCESCRRQVNSYPSSPQVLTDGAGPEDAPNTRVDSAEHSTTLERKAVVAGLQNHPRYRVTKLLGKGGMGEVYLAEHVLMKRRVALKIIGRQFFDQPELVERFRREVEAAARLDHRNIVRAYDAEQAGDLHFLAMEFVEGRALGDVVQTQGSLSVKHACNYVFQCAQGLQHAHQRGMVHRDIKPQNLMLTAEGRVRILDFGLARFASEAAHGSLTHPGAAMGTPDYMAPEQAEDARSADIRADIYSLGCTFYHLLAGHPPFPHGGTMQKLSAHARDEPKSLTTIRSDVPTAILDILARMLAKKPQDRFQEPEDIVKALKPFALDVASLRMQQAQVSPAAASITGGPATTSSATQGGQPDFDFRNDIGIVEGPQRAGAPRLVYWALGGVGLVAATVLMATMFPRSPSPIGEPEKKPTAAVQKAEAPKDARADQTKSASEGPGTVTRRPERLSELKQIGMLYRIFVSERDEKNRPSEREFLNYIRKDDGKIAKALEEGYYVLNGRVNLRAGAESIIAYESVLDGDRYQAVRADLTVVAVPADELKRALAANEASSNASIPKDATKTPVKPNVSAPVPESKPKDPPPRETRLGLKTTDASLRSEVVARFTPSGATLLVASGGQNMTLLSGKAPLLPIRMWDVESAASVGELAGHQGPTYCIAFGPPSKNKTPGVDSLYAYTGGRDGVIKKWNLRTKSESVKFVGSRTGAIDCLAVSPDGRRVLSGTERAIQLWDTMSGKEIGRLATEPRRVIDVAFFKDQVSAIQTGNLQTGSIIYSADLQNAKGFFGFKALNLPETAFQIAVSPVSNYALIAGKKGSVWDLEKWRKERDFESLPASVDVRSVQISDTGVFYVARSDKLVKYDAAANSETILLHEWQGANEYAFHVSKAEKIIFSVGFKNVDNLQGREFYLKKWTR